jgi:DNA-binding protein H-NS
VVADPNARQPVCCVSFQLKNDKSGTVRRTMDGLFFKELNTMASFKDLQEQIFRLQDEAAIAHKAEVKDAIAAIRAQMDLYGITAADLGAGKAPKTRSTASPVPAKYRDPDSGKTWSGRGRAPLWIKGDAANYLIG